MKKFFIIFYVIVAVGFTVWARKKVADQPLQERTELTPQEELEVFQTAYPDVGFTMDYDKEKDDYRITVDSYKKKTVFYRCDGLYLPEKLLENKDGFWRVLYKYQRETLDPADFTEEQKQRILEYSSEENRANGAVSSKFIYDAIFDCFTRGTTESHLKSKTLWGHPVSVHAMVGPAMDRAEKKVYELAKTDPEVQNFLNSIISTDGYNWREIRDSHTKSFHSFGIAIDVLPKGWGRKIVYWGFEKQKGNKQWMLIPLKSRWMPPASVIAAFEDEGFIWGGRWVIWDNMHFEYHPEILEAQRRLDALKK